ncbi:N-acetylmuramoyl-L-alanine amidase [Salisediminibacterium selenitireducens]|uniref:Cell wall hydrolase/autolysin n=1 Tax=Bacillus selenitireducens (strain ATCC 700615 / DSM 15326 / MLS10) TaxID=439292 RepID=D6Y0I7_BACIE|nr:N-acetylmuramoyl-L-alanine amidase [Salisediminibacterium selenitireducens]ADI00555.1 cell wall hydrolase/autolysin [[Bacillus] selenitireducens MLS10]
MIKATYTWLTALIAVIFLLAVPLEVHGQHNFPDVNPNHDTEINFLLGEGVVQGFSDGTFGVDSPVNREQAAAIIGRALGVSDLPVQTDFDDVVNHSHFSGYIQALYERGVISGFGDGTFRPKEELTRAQMAMMVANAFPQLSMGEEPIRFPDVGTGMNAYGAIQTLASEGITAGYPDGTFRPTNKMSRMEFALFMARSMNEDFRMASTSEEFELGEVTASSLNVRPLPNTTRDPIGRLPKYSPVKILDESNGWARIEYKGTTAYVSMSFIRKHERTKYGNALQGKTIIVDAGHGGRDGGGSGNGILEKDLALDLSLMLQLKLMQAGADVVMTRTEDVFLTLSDRVAISNASGGDAFISVHANAAISTAHGAEVFYNVRHEAAKSKALGDALLSRMVNDMNLHDRRRGAARDTDLSNITNGLGVLLNNRVPSVLVEVGFMTNPQEAARMRTESFRYGMAEALLQGTIDYSRNN